MRWRPANPLLQPWDAPYGLPPFDLVRARALRAGASSAAMREHRAELDAIAARSPRRRPSTTRWPRFDRSGRLLARVERLFHNLTRVGHQRPRCRRCSATMAAPLAAHGSAVYMDAALFARIDALHGARERAGPRAPSSCACSSACTSTSCAPARAWRRRRTPALCAGDGAAGRADDRASRRTCCPTRRPSSWRCTARPTSPACPTSCAPRRARRPANAACERPRRSRCRAR